MSWAIYIIIYRGNGRFLHQAFENKASIQVHLIAQHFASCGSS